MKKIVYSCTVVFAFALFVRAAYAQTTTPVTPAVPATASTPSAMREGERVTLNTDEVINRDFFGAGETVDIRGTVNDDIYVAGGQVTIDGTVNGDVLTAGGNVTINGTVSDDVRVAGGNIIISGSIGKNLTVFGGNITLTRDARVTGNIVLGGGNVQIDGTVGGNITGGGGTVTVANAVGGDVYLGVGTLEMGQEALVGGNLTYVTENEMTVPSDRVKGTITKKSPEEFKGPWNEIQKEQKAATQGGWFVVELLAFLAALAVGSVLVLAAPHYASSMGRMVEQRPWSSLGLGIVLLIVTPIAAAILMITIIGLPAGLITLALYAISIYLAKFPVALWIGRKITPSKETKATLAQMAIGLLAIYVVGLIPILGAFVKFLTLLIGLGALVFTKHALYTMLRGKKSV